MQMPFPGVLADYAFNDFEKFFIRGFSQAISLRVIRIGIWADHILLLTQPENFFRHEISIAITNNLKRNLEVGEYEIL